MRIEAVVGPARAGSVSVLLELAATEDVEAARSLTLTIRPSIGVRLRDVDGDSPAELRGTRQSSVELADLGRGERRTVPMTFELAGDHASGGTRIATLELHYVEAPAGLRHFVMLPVAGAPRPDAS